MLKELFDVLKTEILRAAGPQIKEVDRTEDYAVVTPEGAVELHSGLPARRAHEAYDIDTVVHFAELTKETASCWYSRDKVTCLLDDQDRRDEVSLTLKLSEPLEELRTLENTKRSIGQRDLLFMLRTKFAGCLGRAGNLIEVLRQVRFNVAQSGESNVGKGKSSVGKQVIAEVSGQGELPETVVLDIPVFAQHVRSIQPITCILEPNEATQTFQLFPLPLEVEKAVAAAEQDIATVLSSRLSESAQNVPVHYGRP